MPTKRMTETQLKQRIREQEEEEEEDEDDEDEEEERESYASLLASLFGSPPSAVPKAEAAAPKRCDFRTW